MAKPALITGIRVAGAATVDSRSMVPTDGLRVALVHYWYSSRRGGERVLEVLAGMFPQADIFMMFLDPSQLAPFLHGRKIATSFLQKLPGITRHYRKLLPLFPLALEHLDLDNYDLVISSESGPAKGVLTRSTTCHICYCHTPMRYVWDMYHNYRSAAPWGRVGRSLYALAAHYVRNWDYAAAARVDHFVASSRNGAARIRKYYRRDADVIYPPVDLGAFSLSTGTEDFYLVVSPLVSYKRVDLAIAACNALRRRLVVIGQGEEMPALRKMAGPTITFLGFQPDEAVRQHFRSCRALLFPGEEDIGLAPIEVQASGRPVIAYGRGGALETVAGGYPGDPVRPKEATGVFFGEQTAEALTEAMLAFESVESEFSPVFIRKQVERFDAAHFEAQFSAFVAEKVAQFNQSRMRPQEYAVHEIEYQAPSVRNAGD
ncbi:MAG: glycosyltransferase [Terriglobales bacterium]